MPRLSFKTPEFYFKVQHFDEKFLGMFHFIQLILILNPAEGIQPWAGHRADLMDHAHYRLHIVPSHSRELSEGLGVITALRQSLISEVF